MGSSSPIRTGEIATALGIPGSTATDLVGRMGAKGLVSHEKYRGVSLTKKGRAKARELFRRHRLLELFLVKELAMTRERACSASSRLDEHMPNEMADEICRKYHHPETCPCDREIESSKECCPG